MPAFRRLFASPVAEPLIRWAAAIVFGVLLAIAVAAPSIAGRLFWTVTVAALPLGFVVAGYHWWRRICPLAAIAQLPARVGRGGKRKAGPWLQAHAYHVILAVFVTCLWLRLVATNGDGHALAAFLVGLSAAALASGIIYTGKTWCNYFCPVSVVEKLYTEPRGLRDTANSQCATCSACRPACPDINEENSYWKEILLPAKRDAYYAFPGVVLAFYGYYFLQSGSWAYYFDGTWTHEPGLVLTAFRPGVNAATAGFVFWPAVPRAFAAALTLVTGGVASVAMFRALEPLTRRLLARRGGATDAGTVRSVCFTIASFTAFVAFYSFAGAPTLRLVPGLPHLFQLGVVTVATLALVRRAGRRQETFAEETLARRILANWKWRDVAPPRDLREAFLIHTIRSRSHEDARRQLRDLYKSAVRDSVASGIVSRADVHRLERLREQLQVSAADHEQVMAELADEGGGINAAAAVATTPEKQLQLETYAEALAVHLERQQARPTAIDEGLVRDLRERFGVSLEEHAAVVERLLHSRDRLAGHLDVPAAIEWIAAAAARLDPHPSPAARFLVRLLRRRWRRAADGLARTLAGDGAAADALRDAMSAESAAARDEALTTVEALVSPAIAARLRASVQGARRDIVATNGPGQLITAQLASADPYVRATALYLLDSMDLATDAHLQAFAADEHPVVREVAGAARGESAAASTSVLEKMIGLQAVKIFDDLEPEDLAQLARAGTETWFTRGEYLCREGDPGDDAYVILDGEVSIERGDAGTVAVEGPGSCIGELAVLDPAPRAASVVASTIAVRTLRLSGSALRQALGVSPVLAEAIIRGLARRLRRGLAPAAPTVTAPAPRPR